jgi:hypothetical protein
MAERCEMLKAGRISLALVVFAVLAISLGLRSAAASGFAADLGVAACVLSAEV